MYSFFFFSSRRRHTRWTGDWSSDVCSSDLIATREADASRVGHDLASELANQCGLAGAIRSDDRVQLALRNGERNRVGRDHAAEALAETLDFQERVSHGAPRRADRQCRRARTARPA